MVSFVPVNPADVSTERLGRRGRVSYPLLKSFLEANTKLAKLDLTGLEKNPAYLRSVLTSYIRNHNLPIKMFAAGGVSYLMRLDLDNDGNPIENWQKEKATEGAAGADRDMPPTAIDDAEVDRRFHQEADKQTK